MKDLIKQALPILPAGLINSAIAIVDQQFCKALSDEYLYKHLYLAYIPFIMVSVGRVLGTSVKILASKDEKGRKDIYSEFFSFTNVLALIVLLLCVFVFMGYALITDLEFQFIIYGIMQTLSGAFLIILSAKYKKNIFKKTWIEIEDICKHEIICKGKKINIYEENILIFFEKKNRLIL